MGAANVQDRSFEARLSTGMNHRTSVRSIAGSLGRSPLTVRRTAQWRLAAPHEAWSSLWMVSSRSSAGRPATRWPGARPRFCNCVACAIARTAGEHDQRRTPTWISHCCARSLICLIARLISRKRARPSRALNLSTMASSYTAAGETRSRSPVAPFRRRAFSPPPHLGSRGRCALGGRPTRCFFRAFRWTWLIRRKGRLCYPNHIFYSKNGRNIQYWNAKTRFYKY